MRKCALFTQSFAITILLVFVMKSLVGQNLPAPPTPDQNLGLNISQTYHGDHEDVNLATGNVHIQLDLLHLPGRVGHDLQIGLEYNSQFWRMFPSTQMVVTPGGQSGTETFWEWTGGSEQSLRMPAGWYGLGSQPTVVSDTNVQVDQETDGSGHIVHEFCTSNYRLLMPDGNIHNFPGIKTNCSWDTISGHPVVYTNVLVGDTDYRDPLWMRLDVNNGLFAPNGDRWAGLNFEDANGNQISFTTNASLIVYTDTVGRTAQLTYQSGFNYPTAVVYKDSNGATQTITLDYLADGTLKTTGAFSNPLPVASTNQPNTYAMAAMICSTAAPCAWGPTLSSIVLPNGLTYTFHYNSTFGELDQITYPSGGYTRYEYATFQRGISSDMQGPETPMGPWDYREVVAKHVCRAPVVPRGTLTYTAVGAVPANTCSVPEDTTTYSPTISVNSVNNAATTVTDPLGNVSVFQFDATAPYETQRKIFDNASHLLRTVDTTYTGSAFLKATETVTLDNGLVSRTEWDYQTAQRLYSQPGPPGIAEVPLTVTEATGNVTEKREFAYGQPSQGPLLRKTDTAWGYGTPGAAFNNRMTSVLVYDSHTGSDVLTAQTIYEYDNYTAGLAASGATQRDSAFSSTFTTRGNVTAVNHWRNTDGALLTTRNQYDDAGNVLSTTDPLNHATQFSYADNFTDGTNHNGQAFVTQITHPATNGVNHVERKQYFYNSGLMAASCGQNFPSGTSCANTYSLPQSDYSTYSYDSMNRPVQVTFGDGGRRTMSYNDVPPLSSTTSVAITSGTNLTTQTIMDGLGQSVQTKLTSDPAGTDYTDTTYDALGRVATVSNPYRSTSDSIYGAIQTQYDGLGRVVQVTKQDGSLSAITYAGNCTTETDEAGKSRRSCSDALGRLVEVDEPQSSSVGTNAIASVTISGSLNSASSGDAARSGSALTSYIGSSNQIHVDYFDANNHIIEVSPNANSVVQSWDLTSLTNAPPASTSSQLTSWYQQSDGPHVLYVNSSGHLQQILNTTGTQDLTVMLGLPAATTGTALSSWVIPDGPFIVYLTTSQHLQRVWWSTSAWAWYTQDLNASSGAPAAANGSALTSWIQSDGSYHTVYLNSSGDLQQIVNTGGTQDLTAMLGLPAAASGTSLTSWVQSDGPHFVYITSGGALQQVWYNVAGNAWYTQDLDWASGGPVPMAGSALGTYGNYAVVYQGGNGHIYQDWWSGSAWTNNDLTAASASSVTPATNTAQTSYVDSSGQHSIYLGTSSHVYQLFWNGSSLANLDMTANTAIDSGTVTLNVGGFAATACFGPSTNAACTGKPVNNDSSEVAAALAQASNVAGSPATATASGSTINLVWSTLGPFSPQVSALTTADDQPTLFTVPSFTSAPTNFSGGTAQSFSGGYTTLYQYDALGNLRCVHQRGTDTSADVACTGATPPSVPASWRQRFFTYDSLSRLLTALNPESGTISYTYDANGNVVTKTDDRGITVSYTPDELNRVKQKTYSDGTPTVTYGYDIGCCGVNPQNGVGHMTYTFAGNTELVYVYDVMGRVTTQADCPPSGISRGYCYWINASYDLAGDLTSLLYPDGQTTITYTPDSAGRMVSAVDNGHGINYVTATTYGPDSSLTGFVSGNSGSFAGIANSFSYNKRLQPVNMSASAPSQTVFSIGYDFHFGNGNNGNVFGITNYRDNSRNQSFSYDSLNRLTLAQTTAGDCSAMTVNGRNKNWGNSYSYDAWGNLLSKSVTKCGGENLGVTATTNNQLSGYGYDASGNMTQDLTLGHSYAYDAESRVLHVDSTAASYTYNSLGNRVRKDLSSGTSTEYFYFNRQILAELNPATGAFTNYVYFNGARSARRDGSAGPVSYYFSDHLKTASVVTDALGNIKEDEDYYPWGGELQFVNNDSNHYKFTGKERDSETQLDYFGARYYSQALGRFIAPDWSPAPTAVPYGDLSDPQSLNLYSYVRNIPTSRVDEDGHGMWQRLKCWFGFADACKAQADEDLRKQKEKHDRDVRTARFFANAYAKECKCGFDPTKYTDEQLVFLNQHNRFSKTAMDPLDMLQLLGVVSSGPWPPGAFKDVTNPSAKFPNYEMEITANEFGETLEANGYAKGATKDGTLQYTKGNETVTVYKQANSTGRPTAQVKINGEVVEQIRLR